MGDLLFRCQEKVKYLYWQKKAQDFSPGLDVFHSILPWTPFRKIKSKRYGKFKPKKVANPRRPFQKFKYLKKRRQPKRDNACFICEQEGDFARKCPKSSSNKLKACIEIDDFVHNLSMVDSQDEVSDVYILNDASLSDTESIPDTCQKMNICYDCFEPENENELHFNDEFSSDEYTDETSECISNDDVSIVPSLSTSTDQGT